MHPLMEKPAVSSHTSKVFVKYCGLKNRYSKWYKMLSKETQEVNSVWNTNSRHEVWDNCRCLFQTVTCLSVVFAVARAPAVIVVLPGFD